MTVKRNLIANFGGSVWTGLMGIAFVPLYIHFMGIEAYGLIGIFATLLALFGLLDMGLSATLTREMARLSGEEEKAQEMRDLVRTLEIPYWAVGLLISVIIIGLSPIIAHRWVNAGNLSPKTVQTAIMIMGLAVAFQWLISFYSGGLIGLQRQVLLNSINAVMAPFRGVGAVLILWVISPTVEAFFSWQIVVSIVHISLIVFFLRRCLPDSGEAPRFRRELLFNIWKFAAGMTGITVLSTILMQLDKVILSRMLSLEMFGYYTLASAIAMTLYRFITPVFSAIYPRLTSLVAFGNTDDIIVLYHKSAQLMSVIVLPTAVVIALFSEEILLLWTQSPITAEHTHLLVSILITGTAINGILNVPYALQLAYGWTQLSLFVNLVSVLLMAPLLFALTIWYGVVGASIVWVILNGGYIIISLPIMHLRLLPFEKWRWYLQDVFVPLMASITIAGSGRLLMGSQSSQFMTIFFLFIVSILTISVTAMTTQTTRAWLINAILMRLQLFQKVR